MVVSHKAAIVVGISAVVAVLAGQAFNSFACYEHSLALYLTAVGMFLIIPLLPALASLATANPLRAVGACLLLLPWLGFAYYTDCVRPYTGGGASMVYVSVLLFGTPSSLVGALLTGPVLRIVGVKVGKA
ncbi:Na+:solute symporter [Pseudomonas matsuisoli]|uniref:Na+:solute symporter n=1 Tax=Pseudomonas matsuisoli TaxID=1515666 RepID=A0A917PNB7_9PSED|nr:Na+:solute symporter [Pseudomonas matsuisoli]GGJ85165.1 hypothetical protein GCM10009304_08960 [Pseudomonas matsuisoli]